MNKTFIPSYNFDKKKWYIIDCKNKQLGRISSYIVPFLIGKTKPYYLNYIDLGNYVILINIKFILFNERKKRLHVFSPGKPGTSLKKIEKTNSYQIVKNCIYKMLPNGFTKQHLANRLKIYEEENHPHKAQRPMYINFN